MKIVDKYELAKEPCGTPFYCLDEYGNIGKGCEQGLLILESKTFYSLDNKPMFNGVTYLQPDFLEDNSIEGFKEGHLPKNFELECVDTDSNDFEDDDRFLVLDKHELKHIIDYLFNCYRKLGD